jgi:hypothetical protein
MSRRTGFLEIHRQQQKQYGYHHHQNIRPS